MLQVLLTWVVATGADAGVAEARAPRPALLIGVDDVPITRWIEAKPEQRAAIKGLTDKLKINDRYAVAIALDGYELPRSRRVDLSADLLITDSTGRVVVDRVSAATAKTWDPKTQVAVLLKPLTALSFGTTDPEGVYTVKVTIWDQVRGTHSEAQTQFTVTR
jgi:hypothetical protein